MSISSTAQPGLATGEPLRVSRWLTVLLVLPIVTVLAFVIVRPIQVLPRIGLAPAFSLIDAAGNPVTSEQMRAGLTLYAFTHAQCDDPCPVSPAALQRISQSLAEVDTAGLPLNLTAILFDGEHGESVFSQQMPGSDAGSGAPTWQMVTGDPKQLKTVVGSGFGVYYAPAQDGGYTFDPAYVLVDGWGIMRAIYKTAEPDPAILQRDLQLIVREIENSTGVNRYAYEAAHLFLCYPR
jgi:protein SCO1/2